MIRIAIAGSALAALVNWISPQHPQPQGLYALVVDGQVVAAGADCVAAWKAAEGHIPKGWREIVCVPSE
ncbi:hypothetical protein EN836_33125 [Mesorhizobium sp. M1C.F.Ca.ET.193.01.1.1]|uniref:hypothetical protein n=1 Tax=unclassified Mesorhizobium TaxID=325217 RepID=UPI000FDC7EC9|nr:MULTISPECIES: hypothetical protein [unclassified Mesorhizobium]TGR74837.1 hypothetical protein EN836_33125 [Mesorhizobium sp. M1C.F.Ca.ET.193.01.1.1]TGT64068.1 hypothetical protein EN809_035005 [Mesorhizobium sp. M2E.F.Ca.ET.166.01.1.1]TGV97049.1 hypothetical protein EN797_035160 [Mesorhizobium sp. M2E.F.Ca.ET.154.01.1.1]